MKTIILLSILLFSSCYPTISRQGIEPEIGDKYYLSRGSEIRYGTVYSGSIVRSAPIIVDDIFIKDGVKFIKFHEIEENEFEIDSTGNYINVAFTKGEFIPYDKFMDCAYVEKQKTNVF